MDLLLILFYLMSFVKSDISYEFRVCGNYCGPGWCNGLWLNEKNCDESMRPEYNEITGDSCADSCCRNHDSCCGQNKSKQKDCNKEIVNCLNSCDVLSLTCTNYGVPVPAGFIDVSMKIINDWCCGTKCR